MNSEIISTEHLCLRHYKEEKDLSAMQRLLSDAAVNTFLPWFLLRTAEEKQLLSMIGEIDLSDGTAITFTYLDRFTVKMPWDADIAYKLGNVRTVVEQLEANQTGTINLMNDGRADFIPE